MKKVFSVLTVIAILACFCIPAFAAEESSGIGNIADSLGDLSSSLGGLDLSGFDIDGIKDAAGNLEADLAETDILGTITGVLGGLVSGSDDSTGDTSADDGSSVDTTDSASSGLLGGLDLGSLDISGLLGSADLSGFDPTGVLTSFTEGLDLSSLTTLFDGLTSSLGGEGIDLSGFSFGDFDISSILGGNQGTGAGVAGIMDTFSGVLEMLGLDSAVIESLLDNDIVNFFANLYLGGVEDEPTTAAPTTAAPTTAAPTTAPAAPENPKMGDTSTVMVAIATLSVASAAAFVCTRKKHA